MKNQSPDLTKTAESIQEGPSATESTMTNTPPNTTRTNPPTQPYPGQQFGMPPSGMVPPMTPFAPPPPFRHQSTSSSIQLQVVASSIRSSLSSAHELLLGCSMICNNLTQSMHIQPGVEQNINVLKEVEAEMAEISEVLLQKLRFLETKAQEFDRY